VDESGEEAPLTPSAAEVAEILKVMTDSPHFKLLSPLGPELTKFLLKEQPSAGEEKIKGQKKRRIVNVMQVVEQTPPSASAAKVAIPEDAEDAHKAEAENSQPQCRKSTGLYQVWLRRR
jgi:hypothetical protein